MAGYSNSYSSVRNRRRPRGRAQAEEGDVIASAITLQVILCILVIAAFILYKQVSEERYAALKAEYAVMVGEQSETEELGALLSGAAEGVSRSINTIEDFFANLFNGLLGANQKTENPPAQTEEPVPEPPEAPAAESADSFNYNYLSVGGALPMGGWFPAEADKDAPAGSTLSPVFLSAPVRPPVAGPITSSFGYRIHPLTDASDFHTGMDIAAEEGRSVLSALPGTVEETGNSQIYGNYIIVKHADNLKTFYAHCSELIASDGMVVRQGERIAKVGQTGVATGPHLHFSVIVEEQYADPYWVLKNDIRLLD